MAKLPKDHILNGMSGKLGNQLLFKNYGDKTVISKYPDMSGVKPSQHQKTFRKAFGEASAEAVRIMRDPEKRKPYEKLQNGRSLYHTILRELLRSDK